MKSLSIKVTHVGQDYGIVTVTEGKKATDYEVPKGLALAMQRKAERIRKAVEVGSVEQRIAEAVSR